MGAHRSGERGEVARMRSRSSVHDLPVDGARLPHAVTPMLEPRRQAPYRWVTPQSGVTREDRIGERLVVQCEFLATLGFAELTTNLPGASSPRRLQMIREDHIGERRVVQREFLATLRFARLTGNLPAPWSLYREPRQDLRNPAHHRVRAGDTEGS